jgi:hypothetical protein
MDPVTQNKEFAAAWRAVAAALRIQVPPYLANNSEFLELSCLRRIGQVVNTPTGRKFIAQMESELQGAAPAPEPQPVEHKVGEYIAPPDTEPPPDYVEPQPVGT